MPWTLTSLSARIAAHTAIAQIAVHERRTPPRVGTHRRRVSGLHGASQIFVSKGFFRGLRGLRTVQELKEHLASHVRLRGEELEPATFLVFGADNKTLHGSALI